MKKILITGDKGYIGQHLRKRLETKYEVDGVDMKYGLDIFNLNYQMSILYLSLIHI